MHAHESLIILIRSIDSFSKFLYINSYLLLMERRRKRTGEQRGEGSGMSCLLPQQGGGGGCRYPQLTLPPGHPTPSRPGRVAYCTTLVLADGQFASTGLFRFFLHGERPEPWRGQAVRPLTRPGENGRVAEVFVQAAWRSTYIKLQTGVMPCGPRVLLFDIAHGSPRCA